MESWNIVFTDKEQVETRQETFDATLGPTEILCASRSSLISTGTETQCLRGVFDPGTNWAGWVKYPFRPGYCTVAEILEIGEDVRDIRRGDRVFIEHPHAQYFKADSISAHLLPNEITDDQAVWVNLSKTTQLGVRRAELQLGETVGVIGLGILGQLVTQYLYLSGAKEIYAIDPAESRLQWVKERPGIHLLPMDAASAHEEIHHRTQGRMLDVVFDITGHPAVLAQATKLARTFGRVVLLGDTATPSLQGIGPSVVSNSISISGIHAMMNYKNWNHPEMAALYLQYTAQGRMDMSAMISHRFSPMEAAQTYQMLANNRSSAMGVVFDWTRL